MEIFNFGVYEIKNIGTDLEISFEENFLDGMVKRAPVGFLCILGFLGIQYMIGSAFFL